jgi:hypothetical protein
VATSDLVRGRIRSDGGTVRLGVRLDDDPLAPIARERDIRLLDGALEVSLPDETRVPDVVTALTGFADRVEGAIDTDASIVVAGRCHLVRGEVGPVMLASTGRRRGDVTRDDHSTWWLHEHGPMSMRLVPESRGYQQLHGDPDASQAAARAAGLGGPSMDFAETAYFDSLEGFIGPMSNPAVGEELVEDEARFIDHSALVAAMCRLTTS